MQRVHCPATFSLLIHLGLHRRLCACLGQLDAVQRSSSGDVWAPQLCSVCDPALQNANAAEEEVLGRPVLVQGCVRLDKAVEPGDGSLDALLCHEGLRREACQESLSLLAVVLVLAHASVLQDVRAKRHQQRVIRVELCGKQRGCLCDFVVEARLGPGAIFDIIQSQVPDGLPKQA